MHDELDFEPGVVKLKLGGSHGGHNGLRDIHAQLGSPNYWRLRVGIGHPGHKGEVASWVLKKPAPDQLKLIEDAITHSLKAWPDMVAGQMDKATLAIHTTKAPRPKPPRKPAPDAAQPAAGGADAPQPRVPARRPAPLHGSHPQHVWPAWRWRRRPASGACAHLASAANQSSRAAAAVGCGASCAGAAGVGCRSASHVCKRRGGGSGRGGRAGRRSGRRTRKVAPWPTRLVTSMRP